MDDFEFEISFGFRFVLFLFAGKILLILLAFHLLCSFLHLFLLLLHLLCARRHVVNASPISQLPSGAFFSVVDFLCEKKLHCFRWSRSFACFFAAAAVVAVLKKINFTSISRDGRDFSICCAFFLYFSAIFSWFLMFSRSLSLLVFL